MRHYRYHIKSGVKKVTSKTKKLSFGSLSLGLATLAALLAVPVLALAAKPPKQVVSTVVVTQEKLADSIPEVFAKPTSWYFYNDESDTIDSSLGSMVNGPVTPPQGDGSVQISVSGNQKRNIATSQFGGTKLADITRLEYSTYNPSAGNGGSSNRSGYLNFNVDFEGSGTWQYRLAFVPSDNDTVLQDQWQTWDAINEGNALYRYSGPTWPGTSLPGMETPRTLNDLLASYPGIKMQGSFLSWLGIRVGEPYADGYTENIDKFVFATASAETTFDFEAIHQPAKNTDCGKGGWQDFNAPAFSSETECKRWVHGLVSGHLWLENPSQEIRFSANNVPAQATVHNAIKGNVHYTNYDYPDVLSYTTEILCTNANPDTQVGRFMFQIPEGHTGVSGLYVVVEVSKGRKGTSDYAHAATTDQATALAWCQTGQGFSPTSYEATRGWVKVTN